MLILQLTTHNPVRFTLEAGLMNIALKGVLGMRPERMNDCRAQQNGDTLSPYLKKSTRHRVSGGPQPSGVVVVFFTTHRFSFTIQ